MEPLAQQALERLTCQDSEAIAKLAKLVVHDISNRPITEIVEPEWLAQQLRLGIEALTSGDRAKQWLLVQWESILKQGLDETRTVRNWAPEDSVELARDLLAKPFEPSEAIIERFLDQPAVRDLLKMVLEDALRRFTRKAKSIEDGVLGGIGGKFARRGRTLGKGILGKRASDLAENLVQGVADEVEQAFEKRMTEFLDGATQRAMKTIVREIASTENRDAMAQFRQALLDSALDTPVNEWAQELSGFEIEQFADQVQRTLGEWIQKDDFESGIVQSIRTALDEAPHQTLHEWLEQLDLVDTWQQTTTSLIRKRLSVFVHTEAFQTWWRELFTT